MVNRTDISKAEMLTYFFVNPNPDKLEPKDICHQVTKTRRTLFCYSFLVSWCLCGEKKKVLPQKAQNSQLRN